MSIGPSGGGTDPGALTKLGAERGGARLEIGENRIRGLLNRDEGADRVTGGDPLAVMTNHLPLDVLDVAADHLERHGLYETLRAAGVNLRIAHQTIGARAATAAEARLLDERRGAPLLTMTRVAYDDNGRAVEYGDHSYRATDYTIDIMVDER